MNRWHSAVLPLFFLLISNGLLFSATVNTVNLGSYPWLQTGAYANYSSLDEGGHPSFVTNNGTLLIGLTSNSSAFAELNWTVTERNSTTVSLNVQYAISGRENPSEQAGLVPFNYSRDMNIDVSLLDEEAFLDGQPQGIINFWALPLPSPGATELGGTVSLDGRMYNVSSSPIGIDQEIFYPNPLVSGVPFQSSLKFYTLDDSEFGSPSKGQLGWLKYQLTSVQNGTVVSAPFPLDPNGVFDYYTGLAIHFSMPDYPIDRTVCKINGTSTYDCSTRMFGTSLGKYFRAISGTLALDSTNIQLSPESGIVIEPINLIYPIGVVVILALIGFLGYRRFRRTNSRIRKT